MDNRLLLYHAVILQTGNKNAVNPVNNATAVGINRFGNFDTKITFAKIKEF
jgi:hypothetical protein